MNKGSRNLKPTTDHIIARSRGGNNSNCNKRTCCAQCNSYKSNYTPKELGDALQHYLDKGINPKNILPHSMLVAYGRGTLNTFLDNIRAKERLINYQGIDCMLVAGIDKIKPLQQYKKHFVYQSDEDTDDYKFWNDIALKNANVWNDKNFHC